MEFTELKCPPDPVLGRVLLGSRNAAGYDCHLYCCTKSPDLIARINGRDFLVSVSSIFATIISHKDIKRYDGNNIDNDS